MTAGRTYALSCAVWGSNPPARVEWYRGDRQDMKPMKVNVWLRQTKARTICFATKFPNSLYIL